MSKGPQTEGEIKEDIKHDKTGGLINLDAYRGSNLLLHGFKITRVLDDILMVQYADTQTGQEVMREGIILPVNALEKNQVWRTGKVILAGPKSTIKSGEYVVFPNDRGIQVGRMGDLKNLVFLNEDRVFGVVEPTE